MSTFFCLFLFTILHHHVCQSMHWSVSKGRFLLSREIKGALQNAKEKLKSLRLPFMNRCRQNDLSMPSNVLYCSSEDIHVNEKARKVTYANCLVKKVGCSRRQRFQLRKKMGGEICSFLSPLLAFNGLWFRPIHCWLLKRLQRWGRGDKRISRRQIKGSPFTSCWRKENSPLSLRLPSLICLFLSSSAFVNRLLSLGIDLGISAGSAPPSSTSDDDQGPDGADLRSAGRSDSQIGRGTSAPGFAQPSEPPLALWDREGERAAGEPGLDREDGLKTRRRSVSRFCDLYISGAIVSLLNNFLLRDFLAHNLCLHVLFSKNKYHINNMYKMLCFPWFLFCRNNSIWDHSGHLFCEH